MIKRIKLIKPITVSLLLFAIPSAYALEDELRGSHQQAIGANQPLQQNLSMKQVQAAFNDSDEEANTITYSYHKNKTYKVTLRQFMHSTIILPPKEKVMVHSLGEDVSFQFVRLSETEGLSSEAQEMLSNKFEIWSDVAGIDTSLKLFGESGNIYSFYLRVDDVFSENLPNLTINITDSSVKRRMDAKAKEKESEIEALKAEKERLVKAEVEKTKSLAQRQEQPGKPEYLRGLPDIEIEDLNFKYYSPSGDQSIAPLQTFDDGQFTYFQMTNDENLDRVHHLPTVYKVQDGFDTQVNTRVLKGFLIAESVNPGWTLRSGEKHYCVRASK